MYDVTMLNVCGWSSYMECVTEQWNWKNGLWCPFLASLAYVLLYPMIGGGLAVFNNLSSG